MPSDEPGNLEVKVDLLLALAVDERIWPEGEYRDVREILARAGLDLSIGDQARELLRTLAHLDRPYFLSRGWVGKRLEDVLERLERLEKSLEELAASTRQHVQTISANTNWLTGLEQNLGSLKADTTSLLQDNRGVSRKPQQDLGSVCYVKDRIRRHYRPLEVANGGIQLFDFLRSPLQLRLQFRQGSG